ncbi:SRPBCC family protein [Faecalibacterium sp. An122]|uniref:SRPBCC family protein n=1 Tax=Faecalibacterium sp. An122 TaxID=1965551 RepID=UPI000B392A1D|nr:SRPBCC family protein [Faecalibacterium sp. An122]OUQ39947.1 polyketide cyclase [Faecalibacterium sp. An122]
MTVSNLKSVLPGDVHKAWSVVTTASEYPRWRTDLSRVQILGPEAFLEYTADGYVTKFTIIRAKPGQLWELEMDNTNLHGRWVGRFRQRGLATVVDFTEYVSVKKVWMKPFVKGYLKKQQAQLITDLRRAICSESKRIHS